MPEYTVTFVKNRNIDLYDTASKSTFNVPSAYCDDLSGCGGDTHNRGGLALNYNYRENCESPQTALRYSYSGFVTRSITPSNLGALSTVVDGVTITPTVAGMLTLMLENADVYTAADFYSLLGIASGDQSNFIVRTIGQQLIMTRATGSRRVVATLQRPIKEEQFDQCDVSIGTAITTSLAVYGFDSISCKTSTIWQASQTVMPATAVYTDITDAGADILSDSTVSSILAAVTSAVGCAGVQTAAEAVWAGLQGDSITIGSPA